MRIKRGFTVDEIVTLVIVLSFFEYAEKGHRSQHAFTDE